MGHGESAAPRRLEPPAAAQCRPCGNKCRPQALFGAAVSVTLPPTGMTAASWSIDLLPVCGVPPPGPAPVQLMAVLQWFDVQLSRANLDYIQRYKPLLPLIDPPLASANTGWRRFERQHSHYAVNWGPKKSKVVNSVLRLTRELMLNPVELEFTGKVPPPKSGVPPLQKKVPPAVPPHCRPTAARNAAPAAPK
ncbi:hypothetical protein C8R47DRAFT_1241904 [Mycena vitilis]|nr:hypothetical protein C8R47DRAFT_1241904 [Mycena vitilis]